MALFNATTIANNSGGGTPNTIIVSFDQLQTTQRGSGGLTTTIGVDGYSYYASANVTHTGSSTIYVSKNNQYANMSVAFSTISERVHADLIFNKNQG